MTTEAQYFDLYGTYEGYDEPLPCDRTVLRRAYTINNRKYYENIYHYDCDCYRLYPKLTDMLGDY